MRKGSFASIDEYRQRLMSRVVVADSGCWLWTARATPRGYGQMCMFGRDHYAHRCSLFLFRGLDLATPLDTLHSCDNPPCVNPDHLSYGTRTENMRDAARKGRTKNVNDWKGMKNPKAKLSPELVAQILVEAAAGKSKKAIGRAFGVTDCRVGQLVRQYQIKRTA